MKGTNPKYITQWIFINSILQCDQHQDQETAHLQQPRNWLCMSLQSLPPSKVSTILTSGCCCLVTQSCPALCDTMDCSPPGSSVHGISQARILEWVAILFSQDLPDLGAKPRSPTLQADSLASESPGKPQIIVTTHKLLRTYQAQVTSWRGPTQLQNNLIALGNTLTCLHSSAWSGPCQTFQPHLLGDLLCPAPQLRYLRVLGFWICWFFRLEQSLLPCI